MYRDATACFFIALEENNWKCCLDTGRMMGLVIRQGWVGGWVGGGGWGGWIVPHSHTTPWQKLNSPLGLIHSIFHILVAASSEGNSSQVLNNQVRGGDDSRGESGQTRGRRRQAGASERAAQQRTRVAATAWRRSRFFPLAILSWSEGSVDNAKPTLEEGAFVTLPSNYGKRGCQMHYI